MTATPAYREKDLTAGMVEMAPSRNAAASELAVRHKLGATRARDRATNSSVGL